MLSNEQNYYKTVEELIRYKDLYVSASCSDWGIHIRSSKTRSGIYLVGVAKTEVSLRSNNLNLGRTRVEVDATPP